MDKKINQLIEIAEFAMEANDYAHAEKKVHQRLIFNG